MRPKICLFTTFLSLCFSEQSHSQSLSQASLNANNISAIVRTGNSMWFDPSTGGSQCEYPKGSGKHVGYAQSLWITGKTPGDTIISAAELYGTGGRKDFYPGVLNASGTITMNEVINWNRIWKIRRATIDSFRGYCTANRHR